MITRDCWIPIHQKCHRNKTLLRSYGPLQKDIYWLWLFSAAKCFFKNTWELYSGTEIAVLQRELIKHLARDYASTSADIKIEQKHTIKKIMPFLSISLNSVLFLIDLSYSVDSIWSLSVQIQHSDNQMFDTLQLTVFLRIKAQSVSAITWPHL